MTSYLCVCYKSVPVLYNGRSIPLPSQSNCLLNECTVLRVFRPTYLTCARYAYMHVAQQSGLAVFVGINCPSTAVLCSFPLWSCVVAAGSSPRSACTLRAPLNWCCSTSPAMTPWHTSLLWPAQASSVCH